VPVSVAYKSRTVGESRLDLLVGELLVVELKAIEQVLPVHRAIVISYLKASKLELALLVNFRVQVLKNGVERIILS